MLVDPQREDDWDALVERHPQSTIFHRSAWPEVIRRSYGHAAFHLLARPVAEDHRPGVLGLMEVNSAWRARRGVSLPFTDACAPLEGGGVRVEDLFQAALKLGRERSWRYLELRGVEGLVGGISLSYAGHRLGLTSREDEVFAGFKPSVRQALRKAEREGLRSEVCRSVGALGHFYRLHCRTRHRHGLPPQPFEFFENVFEVLVSKGLGCITLAFRQEAPVAAAMFLCHGAKAVFKYGASDSGWQHLRGSNLVMAEGIRWLCRNGFEELDLGRSSLENEGLRRFKRSFGALERRIDYVKYDFSRNSFIREPDRVVGWGPRLFRCMPPAVSGLVGRWLYRHLS